MLRGKSRFEIEDVETKKKKKKKTSVNPATCIVPHPALILDITRTFAFVHAIYIEGSTKILSIRGLFVRPY